MPQETSNLSAPAIDLSVVIPLYNEEGSIRELYEWIAKVVEAEGVAYEVIFIDDGSDDRSWETIAGLVAQHDTVKGVRFLRNNGKSAGLNVGFEAAEGEVVITMDADLQDSPDELPELMRMIRQEGYDLVSGWKKKRHDPVTKTVPSKLFNSVTRWMSGVKLHDFNCGLKAYRKEVVKNIDVYGEMHRYIPVIAKREGFYRIGEKEVTHYPRRYGRTKFGIERFINGFLDLATILFVARFKKKPMHFFGLWGCLMFLVGFLGAVWLGGMKLYYLQQHIEARLVTDQPLFYIALTAMIMGVQFFLAGFLGELVSRNSPDRNTYKVRERLGF